MFQWVERAVDSSTTCTWRAFGSSHRCQGSSQSRFITRCQVQIRQCRPPWRPRYDDESCGKDATAGEYASEFAVSAKPKSQWLDRIILAEMTHSVISEASCSFDTDLQRSCTMRSTFHLKSKKTIRNGLLAGFVCLLSLQAAKSHVWVVAIPKAEASSCTQDC
jgi:hypothetical protein